MNVYIAAPYEARKAAVALAAVVESLGCSLCASWLTPEHNDDGKNSPLGDVPVVHALEDLEDVLACDIFIVLNPKGFERSGTGGRHVELGVAIATRKPIILIGERTNVFHFLPSVVQISNIESPATFAAALLTVKEKIV